MLWTQLITLHIVLYYIYVVHVSTNYVVILRACEHVKTDFDVLLTVHLSIILVIDQLNAQILLLQ